MSDTIRIQSRVGKDGVLKLEVPLDASDAESDVLVTIERIGRHDEQQTSEWKEFIEQTAGSIQDETFRRHPQGDYEERLELE